MARVDEAPEDRDQAPVLLEALIECPHCGIEFDHGFTAAEGDLRARGHVEHADRGRTLPGLLTRPLRSVRGVDIVRALWLGEGGWYSPAEDLNDLGPPAERTIPGPRCRYGTAWEHRERGAN